jgi:hypothetical protein
LDFPAITALCIGGTTAAEARKRRHGGPCRRGGYYRRALPPRRRSDSFPERSQRGRLGVANLPSDA